MVPTMRPSAKTSILAPTRCGVDPVVETMVTSAAGSPRSSASVTAEKTSWFTEAIIAADANPGGQAGSAGRAGRAGRAGPVKLRLFAGLCRYGAFDECRTDSHRAGRRR